MFSKTYRKRRPARHKQRYSQNPGCTGCIAAPFNILVATISTSLTLLFSLFSFLTSLFTRRISSGNAAPRTTVQQYNRLQSDTNGVITRSLIPQNNGNTSVVPSPSYSGNEGYVYILINPSMSGLIKIGMTKNSPEKRAAQLSVGTGVPTPYQVADFAYVSNRYLVERALHTLFAKRRTNAKREFFAVPVCEAKAALQKLAYDYPVSTFVAAPASKMSSPHKSEPWSLTQPQATSLETSNSRQEGYIAQFFYQAFLPALLILIGVSFLCVLISILAR